jgi:hypothetical protein
MRNSLDEGETKMVITVKVDRQKKTLTIQMPLEKAHPSKSTGKTLVIASTHGCQTSDAIHSGRQIVVTANAFIYARQSKSKEMGDSTEKRDAVG